MTKSQDNIIDEIVDLQNELEDLCRALVLLGWDSDGGKIKIETILKDLLELEKELV